MMTWYIGMATMVMIGIIKLVLSFCGRWVQRMVPQAGLLGSLASVGLALIGFVPLLDIFGMPLIGLISLGLILYNLVARIRLPRNIPGVLAAIAIGTALYYILGPHGLDRRHVPAAPGRRAPPRVPGADPRLRRRGSLRRSSTCRSPCRSRCSPSWAGST